MPFAGSRGPRSKSFRRPCSCVPRRQNFTKRLGNSYVDNHKDDDAQGELERALELDPSRNTALYLLGRCNVQKRDNEKAVPYLQRRFAAATGFG